MRKAVTPILLSLFLLLSVPLLPAQRPDSVSESAGNAAETAQTANSPRPPQPAQTLPESTPLSTSAEPDLAAAQQPEAPAPAGVSLGVLIQAGGWVGVLIFLLSLAACTLTIQLFLKIRRKNLIPDPLIDEFGPLVEKGRLQSALEQCNANPSLLASVLIAGLKNFEAGWDDVEKGASEALSQETARLYRQTEFLAVIGNIAPMLGLLGTVLGMVTAFGELAASNGMGQFANLARGIYFALVTTVDGLIVAIPALAVYSYFNHRVATLSAEAAELATEMFRPLKRHFLAKTAVPPVPPAIPRAPENRR